MKRQNFDIFADGVLVATKHKWNSANRAGVIDYIREVANKEGVNYNLDESLSEAIKDGFDFVYGKRVWVSDKGNVIVVTIKKREDE